MTWYLRYQICQTSTESVAFTPNTLYLLCSYSVNFVLFVDKLWNLNVTKLITDYWLIDWLKHCSYQLVHLQSLELLVEQQLLEWHVDVSVGVGVVGRTAAAVGLVGSQSARLRWPAVKSSVGRDHWRSSARGSQASCRHLHYYVYSRYSS